ncbi:MAG: Uncharacterized protein FD121_364 [Gallionellaceae bacterium]|nr:MAG: Uncharacterized protein FD121_364 [Gallionellaceae bacterium]
MVGLPRFTEVSDILDKLAFNPLAGIDLESLGVVDRVSLLVGEKVPLEPTIQSVRAAMTWWGMLEMGLRARNPVLPEARRLYWAQINAAFRADSLPPAPTRGMSIHVSKGPTGTGKSVTAQRFCSLIPQVFFHGKDEAASWNEMQQIVYLELNMSHDGTRSGFLTRILLQIDGLLRTTYAIDLPKRHRRVDQLAVATVGRLIAHYTGILFVDEGQLRNLIKSGQAELMQMFLMELMNSGIPLVMIGNERAFDWVTYSQDLSRLHLTPSEIFSPIGATNLPDADVEWNSVATGVMGYYVLRKPILDPDGCSKMLRCCSGGIARLALMLWCFSQRDKLISGVESIGPEDIKKVYESSDFAKLRPLADGFNFRKPELLMTYPDVDADFYSSHWKIKRAESEPTERSTQGGRNAPDSDDFSKSTSRKHKTEKAKFETEKTRKKNQDLKREELSKSLSPEDIRKQGLSRIHLAGLAAARAEAKKKAG